MPTNINKALEVERLINLANKAIQIAREEIEILQKLEKIQKDMVEFETERLYGKHI